MTRASSDEAYGAFAYAYDAALGAAFFENLLPHLERVWGRAPKCETHLDLACGTGHLLDWFARRGVHSLGLDASVPMLAIARARSRRIVAADFVRVPLRASFDLVTCVYDSLNHVLDLDSLVAVFREVRRMLTEHGLFWFDMNHPSAYTSVWSVAEPFVSEGESHRLEIATAYERATRRGTGWVRGWAECDGTRLAIDEIHYQRAYSDREIRLALSRAGLRVIEMFRFDPFGTTSRPVKFFFVVARAEGRR